MIGWRTFYRNNKVNRITLPSTLEAIDIGAFMDSSILEISIPESVNYIGDKAFLGAPLYRIFLPKTLPMLESEAFAYCNFEEVIYAGTKEEWEKNCGWNCYEEDWGLSI